MRIFFVKGLGTRLVVCLHDPACWVAQWLSVLLYTVILSLAPAKEKGQPPDPPPGSAPVAEEVSRGRSLDYIRF